MTLRRYAPLSPSRGTTIPYAVRREVTERDRRNCGFNGCVGRAVGMTLLCGGSMELDHVQASHGMGMKSPSTADNLVLICSAHHRVKTEDGRFWRLRLTEYLERVK